MTGKRRDPVKVKIIMTQFVHTDARSFKSVVQGLTGRDSSSAATEIAPRPERLSMKTSKETKSLEEGLCGLAFGNPQLNEMERMFLEIPAFDDLLSMCSE
ncbi:hypothetical protein AAC387_Pa06g0967 [Persea americana]